MVSQIHGDKPLPATTERTGESAGKRRSEPDTGQNMGRSQNAPAATVASDTVEVDKARQLYDLESQAIRPATTEIATPEQARSLLNRVMEQFSSQPEQALQSQTAGASASLANLLQSQPV